VQGGTFCPITNCTDLKECVEDYYEEAVGDDRKAFAQYLVSMPGGAYLHPQPQENCSLPDAEESCPQVSVPKELDPLDTSQCGLAREYFGFNMNFVNDKQICGDIRQFQNARSFDFLEEFFAQGFDLEPEVEDGEPPLAPALILKKPFPGKSCV
jgi:hypothetical protein